MAFHRLGVPTYFGGLPAGYDYVNNALSGTPAMFDGAKANGPNIGTYFVAFGEDGTSKDENRPHQALSENTDFLDDLLHRDLAVPKKTVDAVAGVGGVSSIVLAGPVFVGEAGTPNTAAGIRTFLQLVDENDSEIFDGISECVVSSITGAAPGAVWSAGDITLTVTPDIPENTNYRVYYSTRGSNAGILPGDLVTRRRLFSRYSGGPAWADGTTNPATAISYQLDKIVADLAALTGSPKIGAEEVVDTPYALADGTVRSQLTELLANLNDAFTVLTAFTNALRADTRRVRTLTAAGNLHQGGTIDTLLLLNPAASFNLQLPSPATYSGYRVWLVNDNGAMSPSNKVTLVRSAAEKINNLAANFDLIAPYGRWMLVSDGTNWQLI